MAESVEKWKISQIGSIKPYGYNITEGGTGGGTRGENNGRYRQDLRELKKEIIKEYKDGNSLSALSRKYKADGATIKCILVENDIEIRSKEGTKSKAWDYQNEIAEKYEKNLESIISLGKQYNVSRQTIKKILLRNNVKLRKTRAREFVLDSNQKAFF